MVGALRPAVLCCVVVIGCKKEEPRQQPPPPPTPPVADAPTATQWYRAVLAPEGVSELPFFLELPRTTGNGKQINGRRTEEIAVKWSGSDVTITADLFHTTIAARADAEGALAGTWTIDSRTWGKATQPFRAAPIAAPDPALRFDEAALPGAAMDLGGKTTFWRAVFPESGVAKLQLDEIAPGSFDGTMIYDTGNVAYLSGNARGGKLALSCLGGLSLYLITGEIDPRAGTITGRWISGPQLKWDETFTATRGADFEVKLGIKVKKKGKLDMPGLAAYKGRPLIVEFGGSWCDTCKYATPALRAIRDRYRAQKLEVVTFTYELTDDPAYNKQMADAFKAAYDIPWEVLAVDVDAEHIGETMPAAIDDINASGFPITVFVHRDDRIEAVHASFAGPENPIEHKRHVDAFDRAAAAIAR